VRAARRRGRSPRVRPVVEGILRELLARHPPAGHVHLNDLAEVIGGRPVTPEEIEDLVDRLEAAGRRVGEDLDDQDVSVMGAALASARRLQASLGRRPTVAEIARDAGLAPHAVRRALEHGAAASGPSVAGRRTGG
jgi:hypothetical protein